MGLCDQRKGCAIRPGCGLTVCAGWQHGGSNVATLCEQCAESVARMVEILWRQCVVMVVTVWCYAPCYHIRLATGIVKERLDASTASKW
jgi:hypothetical protein